MGDNNVSHVSIQVGPKFEGEGTWSFNVNAVANAKAAQSQLEELQKLTGGNLTTEWGYVFAVKTTQEKFQEFQNFIQQEINEEKIKVAVQTHFDGSTLWVSLQANPQELQEIQEAINMFLAQGLDEFIQTTTNTLQIKLNSNVDLLVANELLKSGERLVSVLMRNLQLFVSASLSPNLVQVLKGIFENMDPDMIDDPLFQLFSKFKNLKLDLEFISSEQCPEFIRQNGFFGRKLQSLINQGSGALNQDGDLAKYIKIFQNTFQNEEISFYLTIPNIIAVNGNLRLPGAFQLLQEIGGVFDEL